MGLTDQKGDNQSSLIEGKRNGEKNWWKNLDQNSEWVAKSLRFIRYQKNGNNREELFSFNFINHQSWVADVRLLEDLGKLQGGQPLLFPVLIDKNEFTFWQMVTARKGGDDFAQLCFQKVHQIPLHRFTLYLQKFEGEFRDQEHLNLKQIMFSDGEKVLMLLVEFERVK
ncbi:MAG: hypothetical protein RMK80_03035 [Pseudobdellovibrionaceae bacterium]|nr:hypothetical protein [Pseudobdellovibrionaceae bacterium]